VQVINSILQKISGFVNALLRLDDNLLAELVALKGRLVRVHIKGLGISFDIHIAADGIDLSLSADHHQPDVSISGPPFALVSLMLSASQSQSGDVYIEGDVQLAHKLAQLAGRLDIDWEEYLAQKTGDVAAHQMGEWGRQLWSWRRRVHRSLQNAVGEYLREESGLLPTRAETEHFMDEVDSLRDSVERLEARLSGLKTKAETGKS
jgi:ubiquinone biosynthesis protein UbiJ